MDGFFWPRFYERCHYELRGRSIRGIERKALLPRNSISNVLRGVEPKIEKAALVARALGFELRLSPTESVEDREPGPATLTAEQVMALLEAARNSSVGEVVSAGESAVDPSEEPDADDGGTSGGAG